MLKIEKGEKMAKDKRKTPKTDKWIVIGRARKKLTIKCPSCKLEMKSVTSKPGFCPKCSIKLK